MERVNMIARIAGDARHSPSHAEEANANAEKDLLDDPARATWLGDRPVLAQNSIAGLAPVNRARHKDHGESEEML
jgi:hypothetical protein